MLIDSQSDVISGLSSETIIRLMTELEADSETTNLTLKAELISDFKNFEDKLEDDPKICEWLLSPDHFN